METLLLENLGNLQRSTSEYLRLLRLRLTHEKICEIIRCKGKVYEKISEEAHAKYLEVRSSMENDPSLDHNLEYYKSLSSDTDKMMYANDIDLSIAEEEYKGVLAKEKLAFKLLEANIRICNAGVEDLTPAGWSFNSSFSSSFSSSARSSTRKKIELSYIQTLEFDKEDRPIDLNLSSSGLLVRRLDYTSSD